MLKRLVYLIPVLAGLIVAVAVFLGYRADQANHMHKVRFQVLHGLSDAEYYLDQAIKEKIHFINGLEAAVQANPKMDQEEFSVLAAELLHGADDISSVQLARDGVLSHEFPRSEAARDSGDNSAGAAGIRTLAMLAKDSDHPQIVAHSKGVDGARDLVVFAPINKPPCFGGGRWGLVIVHVDATLFWTKVGLFNSIPGVMVALRAPKSSMGAELFLAGNPLVFDMVPVIKDVHGFSTSWQLAAAPESGWDTSPYRKYILVGGALALVLVPLSLWLVLSMFFGRFTDKKKYRYLVQNAKSIILRLDMAGEIIFCNEYAEHFFGYDLGELLGKPLVGTIVPHKDLNGQSTKRFLGRLIKNPSAHPFNESMNMRKDGEVVWVAWANDAIYASDGTMVGLLCVGTDITDRKLMEESLRQREKQYRLLAENVSDIIWGLDADLRYTYVSPSDEVLRGFKRHEVLSLPIEDFLTLASQTRLKDALAVLDNRMGNQSVPASIIEDMEFICADGSTVWLESRLGLLLNEDGEKIGVQGVSRDITDRKLAEALREDVERMVKHDLKTPLGAVIGLPGEIRRMGPVSSEQDVLLGTIEDAGGTMLTLINRSVDLYKMECGTFVLNRSSVDILHVFERIKAESQPHIRGKGISVGIEASSTLPSAIIRADVDIELFQSMLSNLVLNALQASPESGSVSIVITQDENVTTISIRNQGEVPPELRDVFFDKYETSNQTTGTGLGTYSARLIARTHGGDITVDTSVPGETCVTVLLPV